MKTVREIIEEISENRPGMFRGMPGIIIVDGAAFVEEVDNVIYALTTNPDVKQYVYPDISPEYGLIIRLSGDTDCPHFADNQGFCHRCGVPMWHVVDK